MLPVGLLSFGVSVVTGDTVTRDIHYHISIMTLFRPPYIQNREFEGRKEVVCSLLKYKCKILKFALSPSIICSTCLPDKCFCELHQPIILLLEPYHCRHHHYKFHVTIYELCLFEQYFLFGPEWHEHSNTRQVLQNLIHYNPYTLLLTDFTIPYCCEKDISVYIYIYIYIYVQTCHVMFVLHCV
jgi:hypothetical protein